MNSSNENKKEFWKSIKEYYNDPEVLKAKTDEFKEGVTEEFDPVKLSGISRRNFLAAITASAAFTATACSDYRDKGEIIPYNKRPEEILAGHANYYSSTCNSCEQSCGILIKTREGRPIKIDGNPDHPINRGKICAKGHANILSLYDPERLDEPKMGNSVISWGSADNKIVSSLKDTLDDKKEIAVIVGNVVSPTAKKVLDDFVIKYPTTKIYSTSLINDETKREAWFNCYGTYDYPGLRIEDANIILSIDADFLGVEGSCIENTRKFAEKREVIGKKDFNRLYVAEGRMSSTGMMADYRLRIPPDAQLKFVYSLISELLKTGSSVNIDSSFQALVNKYTLADYLEKEKLIHLVKDLNANRGKSLIIAGNTLIKEVHVAVNLLNEILGNTVLYDYSNSFKSILKQSTKEEISQLIQAMNDGRVGAVIHFDVNPVFTLPENSGYKLSLSRVKTVITLTESINETSVVSTYTLPINHSLESWGDANVRNNVYSLQQPVISPIFNTRQKEAILLTWINGETSSYNDKIYHEYLINNFNSIVYSKKNPIADKSTFWYSSLHDGVVTFSEKTAANNFDSTAVKNLTEPGPEDGYVVHLTEGYFISDGKFANNGWLQETPHPVTKITWDNYASIAPALAKKIGVEMNDLVEISIENRSLILPALIQPGVDERTINIELGYGRTVAGEVGKGVGFNALSLVSKEFSYILSNAKIKKTDGTHKLVSTQEHHSLDDTFVKDFHRIRKIIQEGTFGKYKKEPNFLHEEKEKLISITREHEYTGNKWAMVIDLNKCTSCGSCVASCNVENNIPVVGKDQVDRGREMQWMRIDRYYSGTPEDPIVSNQPMLCQHCDNAPCENVCPVNATNHSPDGLNQMVYNRCVGTRYCSNNCPYKVRRYNFFNFRDHFADAYYENNLTSLGYNPEVTVRSRGVMEKCTFCVQRIMEARSDAIKDERTLQGTDVVTACQQACPANAIKFGDANDKESEIAKLREHDLSYHVLEELNIKPNVTYIAKLRNTHSEEII